MSNKFAEQKMQTPEFKKAMQDYVTNAGTGFWTNAQRDEAAFKAGATHVYNTAAEFTIFNEFLAKVFIELGVQDDKWGSQRRKHPLEWNSILVEEVGEVSKEMNDNSFAATLPETYEAELVQVAACVFRMYVQNRVNIHGENYKKEY